MVEAKIEAVLDIVSTHLKIDQAGMWGHLSTVVATPEQSAPELAQILLVSDFDDIFLDEVPKLLHQGDSIKPTT